MTHRRVRERKRERVKAVVRKLTFISNSFETFYVLLFVSLSPVLVSFQRAIQKEREES